MIQTYEEYMIHRDQIVQTDIVKKLRRKTPSNQPEYYRIEKQQEFGNRLIA